MAKAGWTGSKNKNTMEVEVEKTIPNAVARPVKSFDADSAKNDMPSRKKKRLDPLTDQLGCQGYRMNAYFPWLHMMVETVRHALTIDRYYQEINLAVDLDNKDKSLVALKQKLCKENGVHYFHCENSEQIEDMIGQISTIRPREVGGAQ